MLSKSQARAFFVGGTALFTFIFVALSIDSLLKVPKQTNQDTMTADVIAGKHLWDRNNCMGCHTLLGEGAYYAPELTKVYERRGPDFIKAMLRQPEKMFPGRRKMQQYDLTPREQDQLVAFFEWVGRMDLNGFPAKPVHGSVAVVTGGVVAQTINRPQVFNQMCVACHALKGEGGTVGPALDGVGSRRDADWLRQRLVDPTSVQADSKMPKLPLSESQVQELVAFLSLLKN